MSSFLKNKFIMQSFLNHFSKLCHNSFARLPNLTETLMNLVFICYFRPHWHPHSRTCTLCVCTVEEKMAGYFRSKRLKCVCASAFCALAAQAEFYGFFSCCELRESWRTCTLLSLGKNTKRRWACTPLGGTMPLAGLRPRSTGACMYNTPQRTVV